MNKTVKASTKSFILQMEAMLKRHYWRLAIATNVLCANLRTNSYHWHEDARKQIDMHFGTLMSSNAVSMERLRAALWGGHVILSSLKNWQLHSAMTMEIANYFVDVDAAINNFMLDIPDLRERMCENCSGVLYDLVNFVQSEKRDSVSHLLIYPAAMRFINLCSYFTSIRN